MMIVQKLREVAKNEPERFNFSRWVGEDWGGKKDLSCGTQACALGWGTTIPYFQRLGMKLQKLYRVPAVVCPTTKNKYTGHYYMSLHTAETIFLLSWDEARYLFTSDVEFDDSESPYKDANATEVADHIETFVEKYRQPE
jgi:hypothetical protein